MIKYISGLMTGATIMGIASYFDGTCRLPLVVLGIVVTIILNLLLLMKD